MKKELIAFSVLIMSIFLLQAQQKSKVPDLSKGDYVIANLQDDTVSYRDKASEILRHLPNGSVIVRLKTNQKSVDAYRKAGRNNIADKIEADRKKQNEKIYRAFRNNFRFCQVFFIYSNETQSFLEGNRKLFLNEKLEHDTTIVFSDTHFIFCEYGSAESYSKFKDFGSPILGRNGEIVIFDQWDTKILDTVPTQSSTSPATTTGLFFLDRDLKQLHRPFPFVVGVYMENYDAPVRALDRDLEKAYGRLVTGKDYKTEIKNQRKKERQKKKESPKYNPFK